MDSDPFYDCYKRKLDCYNAKNKCFERIDCLIEEKCLCNICVKCKAKQRECNCYKHDKDDPKCKCEWCIGERLLLSLWKKKSRKNSCIIRIKNPKRKRQNSCGICGYKGHNRQNCKNRK